MADGEGTRAITFGFTDADGNDIVGTIEVDDAALQETIEEAINDALWEFHDTLELEKGDTESDSDDSQVSEFVVVNTASVLIVALLAMIAGGILIRTLLRSFEKVGNGD